MTDWWVSLPYATGLVSVDDETNHVTRTAPVFRWMVGKKWSDVKLWLWKKSADYQPL